MKTFDRIPTSCSIIEEEIQDRDYAIMELWHTLQAYVVMNDARSPVLEKYYDFVQNNRMLYGDYTYKKRLG